MAPSPNDGAPPARVVLRRTVPAASSAAGGSDDGPPAGGETTMQEVVAADVRHRPLLRLMMIGCEDGTPYGPEDDTCRMFLDLLVEAIVASSSSSSSSSCADDDVDGTPSGAFPPVPPPMPTEVSIAVYRAKVCDYPSSAAEWDSYDGILLPGSLSSAHTDDVGWIAKLKDVIRTEVHGTGRKTLAVCFGHQVYAHSFGGGTAAATTTTTTAEGGVGDSGYRIGGEGGGGGCAAPCPAGFQIGRREFRPTAEGEALLRLRRRRRRPPLPPAAAKAEGRSPIAADGGSGDGEEGEEEEDDDGTVQLLYTHGDMVLALPSCAVSLGGTEGVVPIQAAAYFADSGDAERFRERASTTATRPPGDDVPPRPVAITFQAHPEYVSARGMRTFDDIVEKVREERLFGVSSEDLREREEDARQNLGRVGRDSVHVAAAAGRWLGWF